MNLSFKNRIASLYMLATAILMALVFGIVYLLVFQRVYQNLDKDLSFEAEKHTHEVNFIGDSIEFVNLKEWEEHEHREIQVNPVFIQLIDAKGTILNKSPNLKNAELQFNSSHIDYHFNTHLNNRHIRQIQVPIKDDGKAKGYILAAMSSESSISVLYTLKSILIISYLVVLLCLYFVSRFLAGRSIKPVSQMTQTINRITNNNLQERVTLPPNKDELYDLANGFNNLLTRIENALIREKQFTSDASHEIRTPLAVLKGTLEVLIRKPREEEEYKQKIQFCLSEIDRMTLMTEQLLLLARLDKNVESVIKKESLQQLIQNLIQRNDSGFLSKQIQLIFDNRLNEEVLVSSFHAQLIIENILSNALKYSIESGEVKLSLFSEEHKVVLKIEDQGIGIKEEDLEHIFHNFFRSDALTHKDIKGVGLGLSIAKKAADLIGAHIDVESTLGKGTSFTIKF
jgi:two-component system, OmpR family, heavy metal sensor histidine kinase CusS